MENSKVKCNAFIPARGGSTGVPGKNIKILNDRPLILHSVKFALESEAFAKVIVSTDSFEIANIASENALTEKQFSELPEGSSIEIDRNFFLHKRPASQAQTLSPIRDVLFDLCQANDEIGIFDYLMMLQPTSPFRTKHELDEILKMLQTNYEWSSIASFTDVSGMHPDRMYHLGKSQFVIPYIDQKNQDNKPRQLLQSLMIKDGSYYIFRHENLKKQVMLGNKILPFYRSGLRTINIDTEMDFELAQLVAKYATWWK